MGSSVTVQGQLRLVGQVCGLAMGWLQAFSFHCRWKDFALFVLSVLCSLLPVSWRGIGGNLSRVIKALYLTWENTAAYFASQTRRVRWEAVVWVIEEGESWWKVPLAQWKCFYSWCVFKKKKKFILDNWKGGICFQTKCFENLLGESGKWVSFGRFGAFPFIFK